MTALALGVVSGVRVLLLAAHEALGVAERSLAGRLPRWDAPTSQGDAVDSSKERAPADCCQQSGARGRLNGSRRGK